MRREMEGVDHQTGNSTPFQIRGVERSYHSSSAIRQERWKVDRAVWSRNAGRWGHGVEVNSEGWPGSGQLEHFVDAAGQPPIGVTGENFETLMDIFGLAGFGLDVDVFCPVFLDDIFAEGLSDDVFEFCNATEAGGDCRTLRRDGPVFDQVVKFLGRVQRPTGFYVNSVACVYQVAAQRGDVLSQGLSTCQADPGGGVMADLLEDFRNGHLGECIEFGITEEAAQVALCQTYERCGLPDTEALTFYRIEDLVDL